MKTAQTNYFQRAAETAARRETEYITRTEGQYQNLSFVCGGNLSKGCRNRLHTIIKRRHELTTARERREVFLKMYRDQDYFSLTYWNELNDILRRCQQCASPFQDFDYNRASFDDIPIASKYEALRHFIETYGTATDRKYLLAKFTFP